MSLILQSIQNQHMSIRWKIAQFTERLWWKNYLRGKSPEDYLRWKQNYWLNFLQACGIEQNLLHGQNVLDAGCGPAGIFCILEQSHITAIDPLLDSYSHDLQHFSPALYPNVVFQTSTIEQFNTTAVFDYIFCLNAINHVRDIELAFKQLSLSTKPGGTLVLSSDLHRNKRFKQIFRLFKADILHPQQHDLADYKAYLHQAGFELERHFTQKQDFFFDYEVFICKKR